MKSAEARDAMVARVKDTFAKWPTFEEMPEVSKVTAIRIEVEGTSTESYVKALYNCCENGTPLGRSGQAIVGEYL